MNEAISLPILSIRGRAVVLDSELAAIYGVSTGAFNQAIKRNSDRFPEDFSFVLTKGEFDALISQIVTSKSRGGRRKLPRVFTEHGAIMAATILNSPRAVAMSVYVMRAFVRMREELLARTGFEKRLAEIERTLIGHDAALRGLYEKIKPLLLPPPAKAKREIGFHVKDQLTAGEAKLADEIAADGLSIQEKFRPEPLYKRTGKGHYESKTVEAMRAAKKIKRKGG